MTTSPSKSVERRLEAQRATLNPATGEVIDLAGASDGQLAESLASVRDYESRLRTFKSEVSDELTRRLDKLCKWTLEVDGFKVVGQSPNRTDYDVEQLGHALSGLMASGVISEEAAKAAVEAEVKLKVKKAGINALLKLGGEVAEAVKACEVPVTTPRRISVKEAR